MAEIDTKPKYVGGLLQQNQTHLLLLVGDRQCLEPHRSLSLSLSFPHRQMIPQVAVNYISELFFVGSGDLVHRRTGGCTMHLQFKTICPCTSRLTRAGACLACDLESTPAVLMMNMSPNARPNAH